MTAGGSAGQTGPADEEPEQGQLKWTSSDSTRVSCPSQLQWEVCMCVRACVRVRVRVCMCACMCVFIDRGVTALLNDETLLEMHKLRRDTTYASDADFQDYTFSKSPPQNLMTG